MKKYLLTLALTAAAILSASLSRAQDTNTPAPAPAATNAVAVITMPATSVSTGILLTDDTNTPAPAATNAVATVTMQPLPSSELSMEQRITSMKAYVANVAPAAPLNDAKVSVSNAGQAIRIRAEEKGDSAV